MRKHKVLVKRKDRVKQHYWRNQGSGGSSELPVDKRKFKASNVDKQILRTGMIAELDASNLYEQMEDTTNDKEIKKTLGDISDEEKIHLGEFETLLLKKDKKLGKQLEKGEEETEK